MQTTLLGLGIAIILALAAALVGPHFIDWSSYRPAFEQQATSIVGAPVRIAGAIDARLLPTPSLRLHEVEIGTPAGLVRARDAFVEFSLGALIRGEYRASEVRIAGLEVAAGIDAEGRFVANLPAPKLAGDAVAVERLRIDDARLVLSDARAGTRLAIEQLWFGGDLRSLAGPLKGEGGGVIDGQRFGYRLALGRAGEEGLRVRLTVEPIGRPLAADIDGLVKRDGALPYFEGAASLAQLAVGDAEPWKISGRVRADVSRVALEQGELEYGAVERALKLAGTAELALGKASLLEAALSARQVDIDRLLAQADKPEPPLALLRRIAETAARDIKPSMPVRLGVAVDQVTLGGANIHALRADVESSAAGWDLTALDFRAPGAARFRASGRLAAADAFAFDGRFALDAAEPRLLAAWLEGRRAPVGTRSGALRASGELSVSPRRVSVENLRAAVDRKPIEGRVAWFDIDQNRTRLEADLRAAELDVDALQALARATGADTRVPDEIALAADIGSATIAGVEVRNAKTKFKLDASGLVIERLAIADIAGVAVDGRGNVQGSWASPRGALTFNVGGNRLDGLAALLGKTFPPYADALARLAAQLAPTRIGVEVKIDAMRVTVKAGGRAGALAVSAELAAAGDVQRWREAAVEASGRIDGDDPRALARLLAAERTFALGNGRGALTWTAAGPASGDLKTQIALALPGLDAAAQGSLRVTHDGLVGAGDVSVKAANAIALESVAGRAAPPLAARARVTVEPQRIVADGLTGSLADAKFAGRLSFMRDIAALDGRIEADDINLSALFAAMIGTPAETWSAQPFARTLLPGVDARLDLKAKRARVASGFDMRDFQARLRMDSASVALDDIVGSFAGGALKASIAAPASPLGIAAEMRLALTGADIAAFFPGAKRAPLGGRLSILVEAKGAGRSAASLIASLSGNGTVSLDRLEVAALDARAFDAVERVGETESTDAGRLKAVVETALQRGPFRAARTDAAFVLSSGQVRLVGMLAKDGSASLAVGGGIDLLRRQIDARLTLYAEREDDPAGRPEVNVLLRGPLAAPQRSLDVSALIGWLALRAVDRQAKRLEKLEAERAAAEAALMRIKAAQPVTAEEVPQRAPAAAELPERLPPAPAAVPPRPRSLFDLFGASR